MVSWRGWSAPDFFYSWIPLADIQPIMKEFYIYLPSNNRVSSLQTRHHNYVTKLAKEITLPRSLTRCV